MDSLPREELILDNRLKEASADGEVLVANCQPTDGVLNVTKFENVEREGRVSNELLLTSRVAEGWMSAHCAFAKAAQYLILARLSKSKTKLDCRRD